MSQAGTPMGRPLQAKNKHFQNKQRPGWARSSLENPPLETKVDFCYYGQCHTLWGYSSVD